VAVVAGEEGGEDEEGAGGEVVGVDEEAARWARWTCGARDSAESGMRARGERDGGRGLHGEVASMVAAAVSTTGDEADYRSVRTARRRGPTLPRRPHALAGNRASSRRGRPEPHGRRDSHLGHPRRAKRVYVPEPRMNHSEIVSFLWGVADLIRNTFKRGKYQDVILPLTVLRRLDCVLAPTKAKVLETQAKLRGLRSSRTSVPSCGGHLVSPSTILLATASRSSSATPPIWRRTCATTSPGSARTCAPGTPAGRGAHQEGRVEDA
jgi:hypothetical protein